MSKETPVFPALSRPNTLTRILSKEPPETAFDFDHSRPDPAMVSFVPLYSSVAFTSVSEDEILMTIVALMTERLAGVGALKVMFGTEVSREFIAARTLIRENTLVPSVITRPVSLKRFSSCEGV